LIAEALHECSDRSYSGRPAGKRAQELGLQLQGNVPDLVQEKGAIIGPLKRPTLPVRVLQEKQFERLGGTATIRTDVRVICATHRDLFEMVDNREFRPDLFYRLSVFPIELPAMRERPEDIPLLVRHFG
jgi:sigma54-dependent transcription regulator